MKKNKRNYSILIDLYFTFFKLGLFTIGGGIAMIPIMQDLVVTKKKWLSEKEAVECITVSQSLPGVIAINMATYIGRMKCGLLGSFVSTLGVITPSFMIIIIVWELLEKLGNNSYVYGGFVGLKSAAAAMIIWAVIRIGKNVLSGFFKWMVFIAAFISLIIFDIDIVFIIIVSALLGIGYIKYKERGESK